MAEPDSAVIRVVLIGEPKGKDRPRFRIVKPKCKQCAGRGCYNCRGTGRGPEFVSVYTTKETQQYEAALKLAANVAMRRRAPLEGPLRCIATAIIEVPQSWSGKKKRDALHGMIRPTVAPDWDNYAKILDAFNGTVWIDDKQVVEGGVMKWYGTTPRFEIEVAEIKPLGLFSTEHTSLAERLDCPPATR
jgi:Holliday junction resolvase RusA-like endonuclease